MDKHQRSIAKTITFRIVATITTVLLVLIFTKDVALAGAVGAFDFITKLLVYYVHERVWDTFSWGKK